MDERTQLRIFEPFFTTKEKGKGTGLGLATCFGIIAAAGGKVQVKSTLGQGTTFTVELPLCDEAASESNQQEQSVPRAGRGENVLVAEDDPALRKVTVRVLRSAGYTVHAAADGQEAIKKLDELGSLLDVVVSDIVMPGPSGYDVAEHAKRAAPGAKVILTSGFLDETARRNYSKDLPILWKPVPWGKLVASVAEALPTRPADGERRSQPPAGAVLVVEDDEFARRATERLLAAAGCPSEAVATLAEARRVLERGPEPRLVLCDLSLPDGSGVELLDWISKTRPALCHRVIVLTGGATDDASKRLIESGTYRILNKPTQNTQLLEHLSAMGMISRITPPPADARAEPIPRTPPTCALEVGPRPQKGKVLIVDDNGPMALAAKHVLEGDDFRVTVVGALGAARGALRDEVFDALLLDIGLPDGSGFDLLRELRGQNSELPVVVMTGALSDDSASEALRSRVSDHLRKPFVPDQLLRVTRAAVDAGRVSRLRTKLLAAHFGGDEFVRDIAGTETLFAQALPRVRMAYQPIVRSADGSVFGYEALLRCEEAAGDLGSPMRLLTAADVLGRVDELGRAVRSLVAATIREHRDRLEAIFVNIHPSELRADLLAEASDPLQALAGRVVLEVTERASLGGGAKLDCELVRIRELGYRLAVDDLGEGYSGLSSLVTLHPDFAKIDMSLVRGINRSPLKRDIVAALVDMARRAGIVVIAEGIETVDERDTLVDLGCDLLQGYLFAKAGPAFPIPRTMFRRGEQP